MTRVILPVAHHPGKGICMGSLNRFDLAKLVSNHQVTDLVETGYGQGISCQYALDSGVSRVYSCEIYEPLHAQVKADSRLTVELADSLSFLASEPIQKILRDKRSLVFLDAHYPGADYGGQNYLDTTRPAQERLPLMAELQALRGFVQNSIVVIDDVRIYRKDFATSMGPCPDWAERAWEQEVQFVALLESYQDTHTLHWHHEDTGYAVLWPIAFGAYDLVKWVQPGDSTNPHGLQVGVPGTTCLSLNRRLCDARFSNYWLVGNGLDVGGGPDSIGLYKGFFPRMGAVTVYEWAQGDAQYLANVHDNVFDFVYSGHCLEHMVDPVIAIKNWMRVLKPGGHMVITIPDEDLYEQGVWPSTFNSDHKHTFTMFKRKSWSPVSVNVLELLQVFEGEVSVEKIERLTQGFLQGYVRFDQTRLAFSECGIEFVIKKL